ncbi:MAG: anaerobic ribonucleoside-triphosphate reductase activating protein [Clostridia bacterium]|nr:anaerobic ribonucleoside-triphosphate reductase activating protein [Clostridia bacterium]MBQ8371742.1 anaerobic ribonucleoside-triphosphate reductase activating protein [Clostridia bacterium]
MHYGAVKKFDIANGEGIRTTVFVSGCRNRCPGCFQPETWDFTYGAPFTEEVERSILESVANPSVRGITVLGGEPMEPENQEGLLPFLRRFKTEYPTKTVWLYTGFTYEELTDPDLGARCLTPLTREILSLADILVEGRFVEEKKRLGLRFRGSENQRIIDMALTREQGAPVIWEGCRLDKNYGETK